MLWERADAVHRLQELSIGQVSREFRASIIGDFAPFAFLFLHSGVVIYFILLARPVKSL